MQRSDSSDPEGTVAFVSRCYGAYGEDVLSNVRTRTGFSGQIKDTNLPWYAMGDRFYAPTLRRFVVPDPTSPFDAGGLNRYAYCSGDPINRIDPTGNAWWDWLGAALGIVGAIVGIAATGGALLGVLGAAAAGSLTAAVSTTTMATMTAAVALDVASVAIEIGSIVSLATGDETAAGIFGWMALGTGIASVGLAGVARLGKASGAAMDTRPTDVGRTEISRSGFVKSPLRDKRPQQNYARTTYTSPDNAHRVKAYNGTAAVRKKIPHRSVIGPNGRLTGIFVEWTEVKNASGGINYLSDLEMTGLQLIPLMDQIALKQDNLPVILLTGVHGAASGDNWGKRLRNFSNLPSFLDDTKNASFLANRAGKSGQFDVHNIYRLYESRMAAYVGAQAHIVHAYCFGIADWNVMKLLNISFSRTFTV